MARKIVKEKEKKQSRPVAGSSTKELADKVAKLLDLPEVAPARERSRRAAARRHGPRQPNSAGGREGSQG